MLAVAQKEASPQLSTPQPPALAPASQPSPSPRGHLSSPPSPRRETVSPGEGVAWGLFSANSGPEIVAGLRVEFCASQVRPIGAKSYKLIGLYVTAHCFLRSVREFCLG